VAGRGSMKAPCISARVDARTRPIRSNRPSTLMRGRLYRLCTSLVCLPMAGGANDHKRGQANLAPSVLQCRSDSRV